MKALTTIVIFCALAFGIATVAAMDGKAPKAASDPVVIAPAPEKRLSWENHRLRSANFTLQIESLRQQQAAEDRAADAELAEMQKIAGDKYAPRISQQTGQLEFALKETKPEIKPGK